MLLIETKLLFSGLDSCPSSATKPQIYTRLGALKIRFSFPADFKVVNVDLRLPDGCCSVAEPWVFILFYFRSGKVGFYWVDVTEAIMDISKALKVLW